MAIELIQHFAESIPIGVLHGVCSMLQKQEACILLVSQSCNHRHSGQSKHLLDRASVQPFNMHMLPPNSQLCTSASLARRRWEQGYLKKKRKEKLLMPFSNHLTVTCLAHHHPHARGQSLWSHTQFLSLWVMGDHIWGWKCINHLKCTARPSGASAFI